MFKPEINENSKRIVERKVKDSPLLRTEVGSTENADYYEAKSPLRSPSKIRERQQEAMERARQKGQQSKERIDAEERSEEKQRKKHDQWKRELEIQKQKAEIREKRREVQAKREQEKDEMLKTSNPSFQDYVQPGPTFRSKPPRPPFVVDGIESEGHDSRPLTFAPDSQYSHESGAQNFTSKPSHFQPKSYQDEDIKESLGKYPDHTRPENDRKIFESIDIPLPGSNHQEQEQKKPLGFSSWNISQTLNEIIQENSKLEEVTRKPNERPEYSSKGLSNSKAWPEEPSHEEKLHRKRFEKMRQEFKEKSRKPSETNEALHNEGRGEEKKPETRESVSRSQTSGSNFLKPQGKLTLISSCKKS